MGELLELPSHVIRYWEKKFDVLHPVKRTGGRRYYRPEDVQLIAGLKKLLREDGITIRGVQIILSEKGPNYVENLIPPDFITGQIGPDNSETPRLDSTDRDPKIPLTAKDGKESPTTPKELASGETKRVGKFSSEVTSRSTAQLTPSAIRKRLSGRVLRDIGNRDKEALGRIRDKLANAIDTLSKAGH